MSSSTTAVMRLALARQNHYPCLSMTTRTAAKCTGTVTGRTSNNVNNICCPSKVICRTKATKATFVNTLSPSTHPQSKSGGGGSTKNNVIKATNVAVSSEERKFFSMAVTAHDSTDEPDYNITNSNINATTNNNNDRGHRRPSSTLTNNTHSTSTFVPQTSSSSNNNDDEDIGMSIDWEELQQLASHKSTPLRLQEMYKYGAPGVDSIQRLRNAQFLYKELPIRIAQRAVDLLTLPHGLCHAKPIQDIARIYLQYLDQFRNFPCPQTFEQETQFTQMLQGMVLDKKAIPDAIAQGVKEWREEQTIVSPQEQQQENEDRRRKLSSKDLLEHDDGTNYMKLQEMEDALYRFFTARVGLRLLTEHHILSSPFNCDNQRSLRNQLLDPSQPQFVGVIQNNCEPIEVVSKVAKEVQRQTKETFGGVYPEIEIVCGKRNRDDGSDTNNNDGDNDTEGFTYVPHHLQYMLTELLKNSCRATVTRYLKQNPNMDAASFSTISKVSQPEPIRVVIVKGKEDVTIKVADRGGGVPRSVMKQIFTFAHSTANFSEESKTDFGRNAFTGSHQSALNGFGLPMTRIYARYFGGELTLKSMEGYGLDAYLYLPRLGNACENLPKRVLSSPGEGDSTPVKGITGVVGVASTKTGSQQHLQHQQREYTTFGSTDVGNEVGHILKKLQRKAL